MTAFGRSVDVSWHNFKALTQQARKLPRELYKSLNVRSNENTNGL